MSAAVTHEIFDVVIIGGGQAGPPLAHRLSASGRRVALAERKDLGGSCVNFGCTPTKAAIASARLAHEARRAAEYGIRIPRVEVDFAAVLARARALAAESRTGLDRWFDAAGGPRLLRGHARLDGRERDRFLIRVGGATVRASTVVLDTGTRTAVPPIDGLDTIDFLHAGNWLDRPDLPRHLAIVGGGYIALEMGQFYRRMGSRVTVIERSSRILGREDGDVTETLQQCLSEEGIEFRVSTGVRRVARDRHGVTVVLEREDRVTELAVSHVFIATGRTPNTDDLGLETVGVRRDDHGFVEVDERLATSVPGIWAAGDIRGGPMFTHTSWDDFRILASQLDGDHARTTARIVPYAVFTDPELGRVGVTEAEARRRGMDVEVARFDMARNGKARELGDTRGFVKVLVERGTKRIRGAAVLAADGAELVHLYVDVMNADAPFTTIRDAIHIHPTLAEAVQSAVAEVRA